MMRLAGGCAGSGLDCLWKVAIAQVKRAWAAIDLVAFVEENLMLLFTVLALEIRAQV